MSLQCVPQVVAKSNYRFGKSAAKGPRKHGLAGRLILSESGFLLLTVPNALVRGMFDALGEPGVELPPSGPSGKLDAHISVMRPEEVKSLGGPDKLTERGQSFNYRLGRTRSITPRGWKDMSRAWIIDVLSPELRKLRKSYGLTPQPGAGKYKFHITFAVRRKKVLQENDRSKAANTCGSPIDEPKHHGETRLARSEAGAGGDRCGERLHTEKDAGGYDNVPAKMVATGFQTVVASFRFRDDIPSEVVAAGLPAVVEKSSSDLPHHAAGGNQQRGAGSPVDTIPTNGKSRVLGPFKSASTKSEITQAEVETNTNPTPGQIEAGNYKKGKVTLHGLEISVENPKGSTRSGTDADGKTWSIKMKNTYGYIRSTVGRDDDQLDVFLGGHPDTELVFVVNQLDPKTKKFDEHKAMLGFNTQEAAEKAYLSNYEKGWMGKGSVTPLTTQQFKWWLDHGNTKKEIKDGFFAARTKAANTCVVCKEPWSSCLGRHGSKPCACGSGKPRNKCDCPGGTPDKPKVAMTKAAEDFLSSLTGEAELMGSRGRARHYGRPEPEGRDYDYVFFTDDEEEQKARKAQLQQLINQGFKQHNRPGGFLTASGNNHDVSVYPTAKRDQIMQAWGLIEGGATKDDAWSQVEKQAVNVIERSVEPETWQELGGEPGQDMLQVNMTPEQMIELAKKLRPGMYVNSDDSIAFSGGESFPKTEEARRYGLAVGVPEEDLPPEMFKTADENHIPTVGVDFDGTIAALKHPYESDISKLKLRPNARKWMKKFQDMGARVIIFTVRGDDKGIKDFCHANDVPVDYVNENPEQPPDASGKVLCDVYWDDRGIDASGALDKSGPEVIKRLEKAGEAEPYWAQVEKTAGSRWRTMQGLLALLGRKAPRMSRLTALRAASSKLGLPAGKGFARAMKTLPKAKLKIPGLFAPRGLYRGVSHPQGLVQSGVGYFPGKVHATPWPRVAQGYDRVPRPLAFHASGNLTHSRLLGQYAAQPGQRYGKNFALESGGGGGFFLRRLGDFLTGRTNRNTYETLVKPKHLQKVILNGRELPHSRKGRDLLSASTLGMDETLPKNLLRAKAGEAPPVWARTLNTQLAQPSFQPGLGIIGNLTENFQQARERGVRMIQDRASADLIRAQLQPGFGYRKLQSILSGKHPKPNPVDQLLFTPHL